jgi:hypothetical protein
MHLVERMTSAPCACMICGRGNVADTAGNIGPFLDLERDVNWDDSTYLCMDCGQSIGMACGLPSADELTSMRQEVRSLRRKVHEAKASRREKVTS